MVKVLAVVWFGFMLCSIASASFFDIDGQVAQMRRITTRAPQPGITTHIRTDGVYLRYENRAGKIAVVCIKKCEPDEKPRHIRYTRADYHNALSRAIGKAHGMSMPDPTSDQQGASSSRPQTRRHPIPR